MVTNKRISQAGLFAFQLTASKIYFEREFKFHPTRRWRSDFLIPRRVPLGDLLVEIEGGTWINGGHNRGAHFQSDVEKYNEAGLMGYLVIRGTSEDVKTGRLLKWVERAMAI